MSGEFKGEGHSSHNPNRVEAEEVLLTGGTSPGVRRIEAISKHITFADRIFLFIGVFLIAYAYGLDGTLRYSYQVMRVNPFTEF